MAYGVMAHQHTFPQSGTFGPTSNAAPPMARMFGTNNTAANMTMNAHVQQPKVHQPQAVHVAGLGGPSASVERSPGGAHLHAGPASSGGARSPSNGLPFSHSADLRFHSLAFQPSPTNAPSPPVTRAVSNMRTPSPNPNNQTQPIYQPVPQRVGGGGGRQSPIGQAIATPMSIPPTSPPVASPGPSPATAAPPRLNRVSETPITPPANRAYPSSAPPTPTPMLSVQAPGAGAASPGGLVVNNPAADGRQKKSWLGKIFKKLQAHVPEDHHPHWPHRHHNDSSTNNTNTTNSTNNRDQPARSSGAGAASSGDRNRARATTPPAGARRSNNDRDRTQRHRSSDPRSASSGPGTGNRDRSNAATARSGNRRTSPQGTGPDNSLCEFFMRGECPNGRLCPYRHPGEETLHGSSPRTIARTIRRACRENENGTDGTSSGANRGSSAAEGAAASRSGRRSTGETGGAARSSGDADRAERSARRRASTGTSQTGSGGSPQGASGSGAAAAPARPKKQVKLGLDDNELEMLPCFPFKPLSEAEAAEDDHRPTECHICYEDFEEGVDVRVLPCFHMFHSTCAGLWLKKHKTCPFCQTEVKLEAEV